MESAAQRLTRRKAAAAGGTVLLACLLLTVLAGDGSEPLKFPVFLGLLASGPFAWCLVLFLPFQVAFAACALWIFYFAATTYTRLGLVHWGYHLILSSVWCAVGLWTTVVAGNMLT